MTRASSAAARIAAIGQRDQTAAAAPAVEAMPAVSPRARVRQTVDLSPDVYAELSTWCVTAAPMIGRTRSVSKQDVLAALVALLLTDDSTARRIRNELSEKGWRPRG